MAPNSSSTSNVAHLNGHRKPLYNDTVYYHGRRWRIAAIGVQPVGLWIRPLGLGDASRDELIPIRMWDTLRWNHQVREWQP